MLDNKKRDFTPFDMEKKPVGQNPFLMPIIWGAPYLLTRGNKLKIKRVNMRGLKPPFLVFATHQGFSDYYIAPLAMFPHRANYISDMEGFAAFGDWLYRNVGCIGKRRYVPDISVMNNIKYSLEKGTSVVIFPESRHTNAGITSKIPNNLGRLAKLFNVNVLVLSAHGSYLANPFWDEERARKTTMEATLRCIYTKEELKDVSADEIQKKIYGLLQYNEYEYQQKNHILIKEKYRAEGLHKPLYICKNCGKEYKMTSEGTYLECGGCGMGWELKEEGYLESKDGKVQIPEWYEWQRQLAIDKFVKNPMREYKVRVEALPNEKGFIPLGKGKLVLNENEFILTYEDKIHVFKHVNRESVQTEYNYRKKGMCVVLSDKDCCYYIYCDDKEFNPTELQFVGEYLYDEKYRR